jgi:hypothetical protein
MRSVPTSADRALLEAIETQTGPDGDPSVALVYVAAQSLSLDAAELHAARRRAMLVLAAGGAPQRELDLDAPAVRRLADDLDGAALRAELGTALAELRKAAGGLPAVELAAERLLEDPELAWRSLAIALLADELAGEE